MITQIGRNSAAFNINGGLFSDDAGNGDGYTRKDNLRLIKGVNADYPDYYALHEHGFSHVEAKEAGCTEAGNIEYWVCDQGG